MSISRAFKQNLPSSFVFTLPDGTDLTVTRRTDMPHRRSVGAIDMQTWVGHVDGLSPLASVVTMQVLPSGRLYGNLHYLDASNKNRNFVVSGVARLWCGVQPDEGAGLPAQHGVRPATCKHAHAPAHACRRTEPACVCL